MGENPRPNNAASQSRGDGSVFHRIVGSARGALTVEGHLAMSVRFEGTEPLLQQFQFWGLTVQIALVPW